MPSGTICTSASSSLFSTFWFFIAIAQTANVGALQHAELVTRREHLDLDGRA
jgi:hypothetical protein